jgi:copper chaperone CopZ
MRKLRVWASLTALALAAVANAETIEVDVRGLTCAFCVDSLQRQLKKLPNIEQVEVSLKNKKVRIVSSEEHIDIDQIRGIVIDSGFTPVNIRIIENEG